jgi:predicted alpha/beta hydrolase
MAVEDLKIPATDGLALAATRFAPAAETANGTRVVIASAVGVRRGFYGRFARWLAEQGFEVLTFDYRGIGDSRRGSLRRFHATARDWGEKDLTGVLAWAAANRPGARLVMVGHSIGGQLVGLSPECGRIAAFLAVAAQSGWWGHWPVPSRYALAFLWRVLMPGVAAALGYFPGRRLGLGENLPGGVAREWAWWGRHVEYPVDERGSPLRPFYDRFHGPLLACSFADDGYAPRAAVDALAALYVNARVRRRHLVPREAGMERLGHYGFFREGARDTLWPWAARWLLDPSTPD